MILRCFDPLLMRIVAVAARLTLRHGPNLG
jgi:hypothetical protein